jgi:hypothetical protein
MGSGRDAARMMRDALCVGIVSKKVSYILDADIRSFFDEISQEWLIRFLEHRIGDRRIIRLIQKWLKAGVLEDGVISVSEKGTGQGSVISPLLANIYLHYGLDLWAARWRHREATGDMIIVRYADDFIVGFQHESDARRFLEEMRERLGKFALSLHLEKTRTHRVRTLCGGTPQAARAQQAGDLQLPGLHFHLRQDPFGQIPTSTENPAGPYEGEATGDQGEAETVHAPADPRDGEMAGASRARLLQLSRSADQWLRTPRVPASRPLAAHAAASQSEGSDHVGTDDAAGRRLAPETNYSPSLAKRSFCRQTPEVGAVCGKVARPDLCGGREVTRVPTASRWLCQFMALHFLRCSAAKSDTIAGIADMPPARRGLRYAGS